MYRVRPAWRLARLLERTSGSMGMTRSGRYTLVPRCRAVRSSAEPADEVRDVGDVDAQAPVALLVARQRDRVVEVAGGGRVDRHGQDVAEVQSLADLVFVELPGLLAASSSTASSNVSGMLKARMTVRVSTPGCPRRPRISVMTPSPSR